MDSSHSLPTYHRTQYLNNKLAKSSAIYRINKNVKLKDDELPFTFVNKKALLPKKESSVV